MVTKKTKTKKRPPLPPGGRRLLITVACLAVTLITLGLVLAGLTPTVI